LTPGAPGCIFLAAVPADVERFDRLERLSLFGIAAARMVDPVAPAASAADEIERPGLPAR
jgi:hypothetical protein